VKNICLTSQVPQELVDYARERAKQRFSTVSQYIRELIAKDRENAIRPPSPAMTEDDGKMVPLSQLRRARKGGAK
jgi:hypothetical protein